jgi:hypothetical protein
MTADWVAAGPFVPSARGVLHFRAASVDSILLDGKRGGVTMLRSSPFMRLCAGLVGLALLLGGCGGASSPGPSTEPSGSAGAFELQVLPVQSVGMTIGGQRSVFLVTVSGSPTDPPVDVSAVATGATIDVEPTQLAPGVVGEVTVVPSAVTADADLPVSITASRGGIEKTETRTLKLAPGEDTLREEAATHLAPFLPVLASQPELGITAATTWDPTPGAWVLVVSHYLYFSTDWELGLEWHVMIPPDDWTRIYLRHRGTETAPSKAFEISSFSAGDAPKEIDPPETVWR